MSEFKFANAEACPDVKSHTRQPFGYIAWCNWAERKARSHDQHRCPTCGFWTIWKRRAPTP